MINWFRLAQSVSYYEGFNYKPIEVPWLAEKFLVGVTHPGSLGQYEFKDNTRALVGSAEQSFLQLMWDRKLIGGRFQAITPCFRDDAPDELHQKYFMKNELIAIEPPDANYELRLMVEIATQFFWKFAPFKAVDNVETSTGYDIEINGIEVGSYGIRKHGERTWVYGTACAEPRLSIALSK